MFELMLCCGSTHDSVAFSVSLLAAAISSGRLTNGFWLAWDAAYIGPYSRLVLCTSLQLENEDEGIWREVFNFFQSSLQMHVEQAFGMLDMRFGVL